MLLIFFYVLSFLAQYNHCTDCTEGGIMEIEFVPEEETFAEPSILDSSQEDISNTESEEITEETVEELQEDVVPNGGVNFAGPVQAKGTVSVAATFGYDSPLTPISFPPPPIGGSVWYPNHFYPIPYAPLLLPPFTFSHVPLISTFLQDGSAEFEFLESLLDNKEIYLEITPLNLVDFLPVPGSLPDIKSPEEVVEDLTDYDIEDDQGTETVGEEGNETGTLGNDGGIVFGGLIPASGTVTIAAKYN